MGNLSYIAQKLEQERQELEQAAHKTWSSWDNRGGDDGDAWRAEHIAAMNRLGAALMPFGLGPGAKSKGDDPRYAPPAANVEVFKSDDRQHGPI